MTDLDELEQERKEKQYKKKLNEKFKNFCREVESFTDSLKNELPIVFD